ncbi:HAD-IA family hydrolase [Vibrio penaeicida]|uniref:HAD family hydrolase n=1 Tax=Vibrio penaeicida TaxID=104609 RepID=UPI0027352AD6|nr:HAD-IA family hydrolase [Vibrio penaeicida]MDP2571714.1 HAD-IA family hydrolase [Vibrio penaeicida]
MKNTVLIDFDGVIRHWSNVELDELAIQLGLDSNPLFSCAFSENQLQPAITGKITHVEWCENIKVELAEGFGDEIAASLVDKWSQQKSVLDLGFVNSIRNLNTNIRIVLVTNATSRLNSDLSNSALEGVFDKVINSSDIGVAKPSPSFFGQAMTQLNVTAAQCVFVDDTYKNVESARALGIESILHRSTQETLAFLEKAICG